MMIMILKIPIFSWASSVTFLFFPRQQCNIRSISTSSGHVVSLVRFAFRGGTYVVVGVPECWMLRDRRRPALFLSSAVRDREQAPGFPSKNHLPRTTNPIPTREPNTQVITGVFGLIQSCTIAPAHSDEPVHAEILGNSWESRFHGLEHESKMRPSPQNPLPLF